MLFAAAVLFGVVALLSPYLWRTGKGNEHDDGGGKPDQGEVQKPDRYGKPDRENQERDRDQGPKMDGEAIAPADEGAGASAQEHRGETSGRCSCSFSSTGAPRRALLETHLLTPIIPTPPTERIDNHWEYVRIAAEDAGVVPAPSDSIEQLLERIRAKGLGGPALANAAGIYARTPIRLHGGSRRPHRDAAARDRRRKRAPREPRPPGIS